MQGIGDDGGGLLRGLLFLPATLLLIVAGLMATNALKTANADSIDGASAWAFVPAAMADLGTTAVQVCAAEVAMKSATQPADQQRWQAQEIQLMARYETTAQAYDAKVSEQIQLGNVRPWDVSPVAPPVSVTKDHSCLKLAAVPTPTPVKTSSTFGSASVGAGGNLDGGVVIPADTTDRFLTLDQLDAAAAAAGWPMGDGWWPDMRKIIQCETHSLDRYAHNTSDPNGGSYGLAQLNGTQHFIASGEDFNNWMDPVTNLRVALWLRTVRGHFGGTGGWYICSERWGIS
ncbi:MAG: hypothetical protein ABI305_02850 [Tepidiformaceae bacterium]